jgi:hypothetical protein
MSGEPFLIISSDGHLSADMEQYRPYLDREYREAFDDFLVGYREHWARSGSRKQLSTNIELRSLEEWGTRALETGRWARFHDCDLRLKEAEQEGVAGEVVFPDFGGAPFELSSFIQASRPYRRPHRAPTRRGPCAARA